MKMTLSVVDFHEYWPESRKDQFSYEALGAIYDYITDQEECSGIETEFDPIAICCCWTEYNSEYEAAKQYTDQFDSIKDNDERQEAARLYLEERTVVLETENSIVIANF